MKCVVCNQEAKHPVCPACLPSFAKRFRAQKDEERRRRLERMRLLDGAARLAVEGAK